MNKPFVGGAAESITIDVPTIHKIVTNFICDTNKADLLELAIRVVTELSPDVRATIVAQAEAREDEYSKARQDWLFNLKKAVEEGKALRK